MEQQQTNINEHHHRAQSGLFIDELSGLSGGQGGVFFPAGAQPDIVRSYQKDAFCNRLLYEQVSDVVTRVVGSRFASRYQAELKLFVESLYFALTTLRGVQTLGEEYCDLVQICDNPISIPSKSTSETQPASLQLIYGFRDTYLQSADLSKGNGLPPSLGVRLWLMLWQVIAPYAIDKIYLRASIYSRAPNSAVGHFIQQALPQIKELQANTQKFHLALFYLFGNFYEVAKRIAAVKYMFNRKGDDNRPVYGILGVLILFQLFVSLLSFLKGRITRLFTKSTSIETKDEVVEDTYVSTQSCSLCLEPRTVSTATPCGHLFCWICIHESCSVKKECPVCRSTIDMSKLVRLHHYI